MRTNWDTTIIPTSSQHIWVFLPFELIFYYTFYNCLHYLNLSDNDLSLFAMWLLIQDFIFLRAQTCIELYVTREWIPLTSFKKCWIYYDWCYTKVRCPYFIVSQSQQVIWKCTQWWELYIVLQYIKYCDENNYFSICAEASTENNITVKCK